MTHAALPWRDRAELWLAGGLKRYFQWFARTAEPGVDTAAQEYLFGSRRPDERDRAHNARAIPPIVWAYWSGAAAPPLIARCFANWRQFNPHFSIRVLDDDSVRNYLGELPEALEHASATLRADWIRLELLRRHGGIWLDASTVLTAPLDWVLLQQQQSGSDLFAYYLDRYTTDAQFPIVENWFLAAPPQSALVADLQHEFTHTVLPLGGAGYVAYLQRLGNYEQLRQGIDLPNYLSMHLALQRVLRSGASYRLSLRRAEDGPFLYHALGQWGRTALKIRLLFLRAASAPPPLIKLRKPDRKRLDLYLERGLYLPESTFGRYLCPPPTP
ncbi:MAG: capsular polysaccharide synthesis protein [Giesbergeria sp.]